MQNARDVINRYLQDAIAAEHGFEDQLRTFAKEGENQKARALFQQHAEETKGQIEALEQRLKSLGGSSSTMKGFLAHFFGAAPKAAQIGFDESERVTQNLIAAYTVENSEVAMYEALIVASQKAGDQETERLARRIQDEEKATAEKVFALLPEAASASIQKLAGSIPIV